MISSMSAADPPICTGRIAFVELVSAAEIFPASIWKVSGFVSTKTGNA